MERLQNFIGGDWRASSASEALNVINPASAKVLAEVPLSPAADVNAAVEVAERAFVDWRRTPVVERIQPLFRLKTLLEQHRDELALSITNECGKTLVESKGGDSARGGERGDGVRDADADAGHELRRHCGGHRRAHDPAAAGRGGGDCAVQFSGHDRVLVFPLRGGGGKLLSAEAVGARADHVAEDFQPNSGRGISAGRDAACERRTRHGERDSRSSRHPRGELCGIDGDGEVHLQPRGGQWQARAVPGRREESGGGDAGRGHGDDDADSGRLGVRLRGAALPGGDRVAITVGGARPTSRSRLQRRRRTARRATARRRAWRWAR